jgi:hypothetical protein
MEELHASLMAQVLSLVDLKTRVKLGSVSKLLQSALAENWTAVSLQDGCLDAEDLVRLLQRTQGMVESVSMAW